MKPMRAITYLVLLASLTIGLQAREVVRELLHRQLQTVPQAARLRLRRTLIGLTVDFYGFFVPAAQ